MLLLTVLEEGCPYLVFSVACEAQLPNIPTMVNESGPLMSVRDLRSSSLSPRFCSRLLQWMHPQGAAVSVITSLLVTMIEPVSGALKAQRL